MDKEKMNKALVISNDIENVTSDSLLLNYVVNHPERANIRLLITGVGDVVTIQVDKASRGSGALDGQEMSEWTCRA